jgi:hypothetical protein
MEVTRSSVLGINAIRFGIVCSAAVIGDVVSDDEAILMMNDEAEQTARAASPAHANSS